MKHRILVVADTQFPFEHKDYLSFVKAVHKKYKCTEVIHIGDMVDAYNWTTFETEPDAPSSIDEIKKLKKTFKQWGKVFPTMKCLVGNHEERLVKQLARAGFPKNFIGLDNVLTRLGKPPGWSLHTQIVKDNSPRGDIFFIHGHQRGLSRIPTKSNAHFNGSLVRGHHHTQSFVAYKSTREHLAFDMVVGSGIDQHAVAFQYARADISRPVLSCAVIIDGVPQIIPMGLRPDGKGWKGRL